MHSAPNISKEIDDQIQAALNKINQKDAGKSIDFDKQMELVGRVLERLKSQGVFDKSPEEIAAQEIREAIAHGIVHLMKEFDPSSIKDNPKEFVINVTKYSAIAAFHVMTDGMFLGAERAAALGMQIYDLYELINTDYTQLSPNQRAELVAERVADIIKTIFADQIVRKIAPKIKALRLTQSSSSTSSTAQESYEVVTPEGVKVKVQVRASVLKKEVAEAVRFDRLSVNSKNIACGKYRYTKTAAKHLNETVLRGVNKGKLLRPYMRSPLTVGEIISTGKGVPDQWASGALKFRVAGKFRGSKGIWELVVDPVEKIIYHFNFTSGI